MSIGGPGKVKRRVLLVASTRLMRSVLQVSKAENARAFREVLNCLQLLGANEPRAHCLATSIDAK
jgi:hypothetical protein